MIDKDFIRKKYRKIRRNIANKAVLDTKITANFINYFKNLEKRKVIAGYVPIDSEANPEEILSYFQKLGNFIAIPKVIKNETFFTKWNFKKEELEFNNIFYQTKSHIFLNPDIIIAPLIAFNSKLYRIGFGMGFYDRVIHQLRHSGKDVKFIGVAYHQQYCFALPIESHDEKLDFIITDKNIYTST